LSAVHRRREVNTAAGLSTRAPESQSALVPSQKELERAAMLPKRVGLPRISHGIHQILVSGVRWTSSGTRVGAVDGGRDRRNRTQASAHAGDSFHAAAYLSRQRGGAALAK